MKRGSNIIVKDYLYSNNYIFGTFYEERKDKKGDVVDYYILDDGDVWNLEELKLGGHDVAIIPSEEIIRKFKNKFEDD